MDVCRTNKLFLMRQFGLSQSNFAVKKRDQMYCKIEFFQMNNENVERHKTGNKRRSCTSSEVEHV